MYVENETTGHNRLLHFTEIPGEQDSDLEELTIAINYSHKGNDGGAIHKAVALDKYIIPYIIAAVNAQHREDNLHVNPDDPRT